jgi:two-component system sensor histidine kinase YesM
MKMTGLHLGSVSLKWKFIIVFLLLVTIPTSIFGVLVLRQTSDILNKEALQSTDRIMNTVELNIASMLKNIEDISTYSIFSENIRNLLMSEENLSVEQILEIKEQVMGFYTFHLMSKSHINSISLYDMEGRSLLQMGEPLDGDEDYWSARAKIAFGEITWTDSYLMNSREGNTNTISLFRQINDIDNFLRPLGEIRIRLYEDKLYQMISASMNKELGSTFILKTDGTVIAHRDKQLLGKPHPDERLIEQVVRNQDSRSFQYMEAERPFITVSRRIDGMDWILVVMLEEAWILKETDQVKQSYTIMIAAMLLLGIIALFGFYFTFIRSILYLIAETKKVERGDFTARVKVFTRDELGILGMRFNRMVSTIESLIDSKYKLEIKRKESELKALQAQISPHFLYNTLDTIRWTARMEKAMKTSRLIEILSRFLRMGLSGGKVWVDLEDELLYTKSYLELQQERMGKELHYSITVDASIENVRVPKQILQPLVENSIVHGFENQIGEKWIRIHCYAIDTELFIDVIDNGNGFPPHLKHHTLEQVMSQGKGYAMKNIHERLNMVFSAAYGLQMVEQEGEGAWLRIRMPLIPQNTLPDSSDKTGNGSQV